MALSGVVSIFTSSRVADRSSRSARSRRGHRSASVALVAGLVLGLAPTLASAQLNAAIAANRTSGVAPLAVRFDATGSDCNGNGSGNQWNQDLEQCLYSWDFGDPSAPPYTTGAAALAGQNPSANQARGFIAGHVYENPGTYTARLTIRNPGGQTATRTQQITVSAFSGSTRCISATGNFAGCPSGAQNITQSNFNSALSSCTSSGARRCLFRRGDTFSRGGETNLPNGPGIIGAFGTGNRPIVTGTGFTIGNGSDWRIMDMDFNGPAMFGASHRLFYRTAIRNTGSNSAILWWGTGNSNLYFVRSSIDNAAKSGGSIGYYVTAENQVFLGSSIKNSGTQPGGHQLRVGDHSRSVFASNEIGPASDGHGFKVTGENSQSPGVSHWVFRDNLILDGGKGFNRVVSMVPQVDDSPGPVKRGLLESNYCKGSTLSNSHDDRTCFYMVELQDMTFRNNIVDQTQRFASLIQIRFQSGSPWGNASNVTIANNTSAYTSGNSGDKASVIEVQSGMSNVRVVNNLFYGPSYSPPIVSCAGSSCSQNANNLKVSTNPFTGTPPLGHPWLFRLKAGSAPIGAGTANAESFFDFAGNVRTGSRDIGAWELATAAPPPPPVLLP